MPIEPVFIHRCIVMVLSGAASVSLAAPDRVTVVLGAQEYWDSNFARSDDTDSEHYTRSVMTLQLNERKSKQDFALIASGNHYEYAERNDLNASFYEGQVKWRSDWSHRIKTAVHWSRDAYAVDRLEFADKDIVALEKVQGQINMLVTQAVSVVAGARRAEQTHSNRLRKALNFDEDEGFVAATYTSANQSSLGIGVREGERLYWQPLQTSPDGRVRLLDFDYRQIELEGRWALTGKTHLGFTLGRFKREGDINTGTGTAALVDASWAISEKLKLSLSYSQSEPAVGETSDSPADTRTRKLALGWEPSAKWLLSIDASYTDLTYLARLNLPQRDETVTAISPLQLMYRFSDGLAIRMDSQWVERQSPLQYRDYHYTLASLGLTLTF